MDEQKLNESTREKYETPTCKRFLFETNDLIQASGETPKPVSISPFQIDASDVDW